METWSRILSATLLLMAACSKVDLSAPPDSIISLSSSLTAIPSDGGETELAATVVTTDNSPVLDGTVVFFFTNLGTVEQQSNTVAGVARSMLRSSGQTGVATVSAVSGAAAPASLEVTIGLLPESLGLSAVPSQIPAGGGSVMVVATVRGAGAHELPGQTVLFTATQPGRLASGGDPVITDASGRAVDTLTSTAGTTVTAAVVGTDPVLTQDLAVGLATSPLSTLVVSANPGSLPTGGGDAVISAVAFDLGGAPVPGISVGFSVAPFGSLSSSSGVSDSIGQVQTTLTTVESTRVTATAESLSDYVNVLVGSQQPTRLLYLTFERGIISDTSSPGINACADPGSNSQLPVRLIGQVTDLVGDPVDGVVVDLAVEDLESDPWDAQGGFCSGLTDTASGVSGTDGAGTFELKYSIEGLDLNACVGLSSGECTATVIGSSEGLDPTSATIQFH